MFYTAMISPALELLVFDIILKSIPEKLQFTRLTRCVVSNCWPSWDNPNCRTKKTSCPSVVLTTVPWRPDELVLKFLRLSSILTARVKATGYNGVLLSRGSNVKGSRTIKRSDKTEEKGVRCFTFFVVKNPITPQVLGGKGSTDGINGLEPFHFEIKASSKFPPFVSYFLLFYSPRLRH